MTSLGERRAMSMLRARTCGMPHHFPVRGLMCTNPVFNRERQILRTHDIELLIHPPMKNDSTL
jgi:hypothetical protein